MHLFKYYDKSKDLYGYDKPYSVINSITDDTEWFINGDLNSINDEPAIVSENGNNTWYKDGLIHREGKPAIKYADGAIGWYINGKRHRIGGPAVTLACGIKSWWKHDKLHREDGPAVDYGDGDLEWFINGKKLTEKEFNEKMLNSSK